jgi:hypothetical protein
MKRALKQLFLHVGIVSITLSRNPKANIITANVGAILITLAIVHIKSND